MGLFSNDGMLRNAPVGAVQLNKKYTLSTAIKAIGVLSILGGLITASIFKGESGAGVLLCVIAGILNCVVCFGIAKCVKAACVYLESKELD